MDLTLPRSLGVFRWLFVLMYCILRVAPADAQVIYLHDDGVSETHVRGGPPEPADLWWAQGFTVQPGGETIISIEIAYGLMPDGMNVELLLYDDPTNDLDPNDAILLTSILTTSMLSGTDTFISVPITPTTVSGDFFVGALTSNTAREFPLAFDTTTSAMATWIAENTNGPGTINPANVGGTSTFGPALIDSLGLPGNALLRATGVPEPSGFAMACLGLFIIARRRNRNLRSI